MMARSITLRACAQGAALRLWILAVILSGITPLDAEDRFPRPEFDSRYETPFTSASAPDFSFESMADIVLLVVFLAAAAWLGIRKRNRRWLFILGLLSLLYFGFLRAGCVCPIGATQNTTLALFNSVYTLPVVVAAFFFIPLIASLFSGRSFCSSVCPLGAIQEAVIVKPVRVPQSVSSVLSVMPYAYLGLSVLLVASGGGFIICQYDPFVGIFRLNGPLVMIAAGVVLLIAGMFIARPYCQFLCPYGIVLGWLSTLSWRHVTITPNECVGCHLCKTSCPYDAIREPKPLPANHKEQERRKREIRRLLLLWPVLVGVYALLGLLLAPAFEALRGVVSDYNAPAVDLSTGSTLYGAFMGFVIGLLAIREPFRKPTADYTIDALKCLSCARCFAACPQETALRRTQRSSAENTETPIAHDK